MPVNEETARQLNREVRNLVERLNFDEAYEVFKAKLLDQFRRNELDADSLAGYVRQVRRIFDPQFQSFVDKTYHTYDDILQVVNQSYDDLGIDIHRDLPRIQAAEKVNQQQYGEYSNQAVRDIAREIRKHAAEGGTTAELATRLENSTDDRLQSYANTLGRTIGKAYSQTAVVEKARIAEVEYYRYIGIERATTRIFCRELLDQGRVIFHINDIQKMNNAHGLPVLFYRGGYRCFHDWLPLPGERGEGYTASFYTVSSENKKKQLKLARGYDAS